MFLKSNLQRVILKAASLKRRDISVTSFSSEYTTALRRVSFVVGGFKTKNFSLRCTLSNLNSFEMRGSYTGVDDGVGP